MEALSVVAPSASVTEYVLVSLRVPKDQGVVEVLGSDPGNALLSMSPPL
jgi:hypothetical protein